MPKVTKEFKQRPETELLSQLFPHAELMECACKDDNEWRFRDPSSRWPTVHVTRYDLSNIWEFRIGQKELAYIKLETTNLSLTDLVALKRALNQLLKAVR
jgi:hypothetical protein